MSDRKKGRTQEKEGKRAAWGSAAEEGVKKAGPKAEDGIRERYLDTVTAQMRCRQARTAVREEIRQHLEDQTEALCADGMEYGEACSEAVRQMGDPVEVGVAMDEIHRPKMPWGMLGLAGGLSLVCFAVQAILQNAFPQLHFLPGGAWKQFGFVLMGIAIMSVVCFVDYSRIGRYAKQLYVLFFVVLFLGIWIWGRQVNGARRWIVAGGIRLNMCLLAYLFIPLYAGILYQLRGQGYRAVGKAVLWMILPLMLVFYTPDLTDTFVLTVSFAAVLTAAVGKGWFRVKKRMVIAGIWGVLLVLPAGAVCHWLPQNGYRGDRLRAIFGIGGKETYSYQVNVIRDMMGKSSLIGNSISGEISSLGDESQSVLSYAIAYYGILAGVLLVGAILFLILRLLRTAKRQSNQLGMLMGAGCCSVFLFQLWLYVLNNTGVFAVFSGTYCPFLTYGGTGTAVSYIMLGLLLSICRFRSVPLDPERAGRRKESRLTLGSAGRRKESRLTLGSGGRRKESNPA